MIGIIVSGLANSLVLWSVVAEVLVAGSAPTVPVVYRA